MTTTTQPIVQVIGAKWCKLCPGVKNSVTDLCKMVGLEPIVLDYNDLETDDPDLYVTITSVPTVRIFYEHEWRSFSGKNFMDPCKTAILALAIIHVTNDSDF